MGPGVGDGCLYCSQGGRGEDGCLLVLGPGVKVVIRWMSMSTRARGEGVKGMRVYDCWVQVLGVAIYGCFTYLLIC